jgi:prophage antirepressor-like protein
MALVPAGVAFDASSKALSINGTHVKIYFFADDPMMPWFFAKPIHTRLGATKIGQTLKRVSASRKSSLGDLIAAKGQPVGVGSSDPTFGYHDKKAIYINEPGLYDVLLGSHKEEAVLFRDWVTGVVLLSLRRTGTYSVSQSMPVEDDSIPSPIGRPVAKLAPKQKKALGEPVISWKNDLGAERKEIPAAKAVLRALFEIEVAAGAMARTPEPTCSAPQFRFRALAEAALLSSRETLQRRLGKAVVVAAAAKKRRLLEDEKEATEEEQPDKEVEPAPQLPGDEDDVLRVSEVMARAGVWDPVWKAYRSDLSNRMLQLKCEETHGAFAERRPQEVSGSVMVDVHSYKRSQDWPLARRALRETKDLYEKRIRELLESAFSAAGIYDNLPARTHAGVSGDAARKIAERLFIEEVSGGER